MSVPIWSEDLVLHQHLLVLLSCKLYSHRRSTCISKARMLLSWTRLVDSPRLLLTPKHMLKLVLSEKASWMQTPLLYNNIWLLLQLSNSMQLNNVHNRWLVASKSTSTTELLEHCSEVTQEPLHTINMADNSLETTVLRLTTAEI